MSTSNYNYNQIVNPETNRTVNTNSRIGKKVLEKYKTLLNISQQGGANEGTEWRTGCNIISIKAAGQQYWGIFMDGSEWAGWGKKTRVANAIVKSNTQYLANREKWTFDATEGALRESNRCQVLLPKEQGCYSMIVIDPTATYGSGVPTIVGYVIATRKQSNSGNYKGADFIYFDYVEVSTDYQGRGLCQPMLSSIINIFKTRIDITSFKIYNASDNSVGARKCYVRAAKANGLTTYNIPYHESQGNFPVHLCGLCKLKEHKEGSSSNLDNDLVNDDGIDGEDYYMVEKGLLERFSRGFDYPDCYYLYSDSDAPGNR